MNDGASGTPMTGRATYALIIGGAALILVMGAAHGDLPEGSGEAALRFVAGRRTYAAVHFGSIVGAVLWVLGLRGYPQLLDDARARLVAQWASAAATVGAGVLAVQFSLDGFGLPAIAGHFTAADPVGRETLAHAAEITADAMIGLALMWVILLYGLAIVLVAASSVLDPSGDHWVGAVGMVVGIWTGTAALAVALGATVIPDWLAFVSGIVGGNLWLIGWATLAWGRLGKHDNQSVESVPGCGPQIDPS